MVQRGNNVFGRVGLPLDGGNEGPDPEIRDMFLHALFARLALRSNENIEFSTEYDSSTNTIELVIPDGSSPLFDQLTGIQRGEKFKTFINWLIGSEVLTAADLDPNFISASAMSVWAGATQGSLDGKQSFLYLPASELSVVGYNTKIDDSFQSGVLVGSMKIYLIWVYDAGVNTSFDIKTDVKITEIATGNTIEVANPENISTFNLLKGDIRETEIISVNNLIHADDIINVMISRNYDGSPDAQTELTGIMGLRIELSG